LAKAINESSTTKQDSLDEDLLRTFAYQATGDICSMQAVIGGMAAQEVMKVRNLNN
jgi:ubiquitin-activating enzyme E1